MNGFDKKNDGFGEKIRDNLAGIGSETGVNYTVGADKVNMTKASRFDGNANWAVKRDAFGRPIE